MAKLDPKLSKELDLLLTDVGSALADIGSFRRKMQSEAIVPSDFGDEDVFRNLNAALGEALSGLDEVAGILYERSEWGL